MNKQHKTVSIYDSRSCQRRGICRSNFVDGNNAQARRKHIRDMVSALHSRLLRRN